MLKHIISEFLPKKFEVSSGFVYFPKQYLADLEEALEKGINFGDYHDISKQIDIVVFDASEHPVLFRDGGLVILRPESVKAIIEVKGALSQKSTDEALDLFIDYSYKWKQCREFYLERGTPDMKPPSMFLMAWNVSFDKKGYPKTDGSRLRKRILKNYKDKVSKEDLPGFPLLNSAYIYRDCIVHEVFVIENKEPKFQFGYTTSRGRFVRLDREGNPELGGDKTVSSLLSSVHSALDIPINIALAYADQTNKLDVLPHEHSGFECWLVNDEIDSIAPKLSELRK